MRGLKFRAWSNQLGSYVKWIFIKPDGNLVSKCVGYGVQEEDSNDYIIEQYTGLKDKNGKEIYEGDIVRYFNTEDHIAEAIIRFGNPPIPYTSDDGTLYLKGFYLDWLRTYNDEDFTDDEWERLDDLGGDYEVIGNIHENPELLEGE